MNRNSARRLILDIVGFFRLIGGAINYVLSLRSQDWVNMNLFASVLLF